MIKLLIVDDEEEIRSGIRDLIDWEANGIRVCGEAANGVDALNYIDTLLPDILLIDIRMPVKSGLEVIEDLHRRGLPVKAIVLSGYDDFTYAQKSLKFGVSDYLLKPSRPQEILATVLKAKTALEEERSKKDIYDKLRVHFNMSLPILKEKYLTRMIEPEKKQTEKIREDFKQLNIDLDIRDFLVLVLRIDGFSAFSENKSSRDIELMKFAVKNITEEILRTKYRGEVFEFRNDLIAILNVPTPEAESLRPLSDNIGDNVSKYLGFTISIGLGRHYEDVNGIHHSYSEAVSSIDTAFFIGPASVIQYKDIHVSLQDEFHYPVGEEKEILTSIKAGDAGKLKNSLKSFFDTIVSGKLSKDNLLKSSAALSLSLYHLCIELNLEVSDVLGQGFSFLNEINRLDNAEEVRDKLSRISEALIDKVNGKKSGNRIIDTALKYIGENYSTDLSLESVAKKVYISAGYLSMLFKQAVGVNFVDYLHKVRIERACELLKDVRLKTYEVAFKVGYGDEKYFAQIFKKQTGLTPTQYRESN